MDRSFDRIDFRISPITEAEAALAGPKAVKVDVLINDAAYPDQTFDVAGVLFGGDARISAFYLFTCDTCDTPGCAGFHLPLNQRRDEKTVAWSIDDGKLANVLGTDKLIFEATEFDTARARLKTELEALEAKGIHAETLLDTDWDEEDSEVRTAYLLSEVSETLTPYHRGQTELADALEAATDPRRPGMIRFSWGKPAEPEAGQEPDPEVFQGMTAADAAARLLNIGDCVTPHNRPRVAVLKEATAIVQSFASTADAAAANRAFAPLRRFLEEDGVDTPEEAIFHVDERGPFARFP